MKICSKCNREVNRLKRKLCDACYEYARLHHLIDVRAPCIINNLTPIQLEHMIGSMLGDGSIEMGKLAKQARLCIGRQSKDKEYLIWQSEIFKNLCEKNCVKHAAIFDKRTEKTYLKTSFRTRNCPVITKYWEKWYLAGKKIIPKDIEFTSTILLIWFLDDGSVHYDNSKNCSTMRLDLSTMGFSNEENLFLASKLSEYIESDVNVLQSKNKCYLRLTNKSARKFISIIDNIFPDSMLRKAKWRNIDCDYYTRIIK